MKMSFAQRIMDEPFDQEWPLRGDVYFWNLIRAQARNWDSAAIRKAAKKFPKPL